MKSISRILLNILNVGVNMIFMLMLISSYFFTKEIILRGDIPSFAILASIYLPLLFFFIVSILLFILRRGLMFYLSVLVCLGMLFPALLLYKDFEQFAMMINGESVGDFLKVARNYIFFIAFLNVMNLVALIVHLVRGK